MKNVSKEVRGNIPFLQLKFLDGCRVCALRGQADRHDPLRVVAWKPVGDGEHPLSQLVREQIEQRCHICPQLGSLPENGTLAQEENLGTKRERDVK